MADTPALELIGIDKRFGAVHANRAVSLRVMPGSIHGIVGENGAGKSTLMSILYGFYEADAGEIRVSGETVRIRSSRDAIAAGIGMVHQHFMLVEPLSVLDNVMLGAEGGALLAKGEASVRAKLAVLARDYGLDVDPDASVETLPVGLQQRVEILKALVRDARILILDEPTAVLTPAEADKLFDMLRLLAGRGRTIIFITHKLREIMHVTDRVSVMRRGEMTAHFETAATSPPQLAEAMVGRPVLLKVEKKPPRPGAVLLRAEHITLRDARGVKRLDDISLDLRAGEIVGIAGVSGNGQSELMDVLTGITSAEGDLTVKGRMLRAGEASPALMRTLGIAHVPEDRHKRGLVMAFEAYESAMLGYQEDRRFGAGLLIDRQAAIADLATAMDTFDIRPRTPRLKTANFSGGNQQKIVLAREIDHGADIIIVGQPTRGVDIGAIEFIHRRLIELRDAGKAILLISVELDEVMSLSDRIVALCGGRITGERRPEETDASELGLMMAGVTERAA